MKQTIYRLYPFILGIILLTSLAFQVPELVHPTVPPDEVEVNSNTGPLSASIIANVDSGIMPTIQGAVSYLICLGIYDSYQTISERSYDAGKQHLD